MRRRQTGQAVALVGILLAVIMGMKTGSFTVTFYGLIIALVAGSAIHYS